MFSEFDLCFQPGFLRAVYLLKTLLNIIRIAVPIGVIIKSILDIYKGILDPKDKDGLNSLKNRFIAMVIVFLVPTIINAFMGLVNYVMGKDVYNGVTECWDFANPEYIEILQVQYEDNLAQMLLTEEEQKKSYQDQAKILLERIIANQKLANKVGEYKNNANTINCGSGPSYNSQLQSYVHSAGYRTRAGVVAAANFLSSHVNIHIPYFWTGGHVHTYSGYINGNERGFDDFIKARQKGASFEATLGLSPYWGCSTKMELEDGTENQPIDSYTPFGMDCSGFVVWAIRNGGYDTNCSFSAGKEDGLLRKFCGQNIDSVSVSESKGRVQAGDVVYTPGHVGMVVEVRDDGFSVAEESGFKEGLIVTEHAYSDSSDFDYVLLLDNFYNS